MRTPIVYNSVIRRGITFQRNLALKNEDGSPFDLTGCQILSQMRRNPDAEEKVDFDIDIDDDATTGLFKWSMAHTVTQELEVRDYVHDMILVTAEPARHLIREGRMGVANTVTR